jgi:Tol biopolymer transport system component
VPAVAQAAYPGANGRIAFQRNDNIFTIRPGGAGLTNVTKTPNWYEESPSISPNGNRVAYDVSPVGNAPDSGIFTERANGTSANPTFVTRNFRSKYIFVHHPAWSPNGVRIAFFCYLNDGSSELCKIKADGTSFSRITFCDCVSISAAIEWSTQGRILFKESGESLASVAASGGPVQHVGAGRNLFNGDWSSNGAQFIGDTDFNGDLFRRNANGSGETQVWAYNTTSVPKLNDPAYAPDGTKFVVRVLSCLECSSPVQRGLVLFTPPNTFKQLTTASNDREPDWGPAAQ